MTSAAGSFEKTAFAAGQRAALAALGIKLAIALPKGFAARKALGAAEHAAPAAAIPAAAHAPVTSFGSSADAALTNPFAPLARGHVPLAERTSTHFTSGLAARPLGATPVQEANALFAGIPKKISPEARAAGVFAPRPSLPHTVPEGGLPEATGAFKARLDAAARRPPPAPSSLPHTFPSASPAGAVPAAAAPGAGTASVRDRLTAAMGKQNRPVTQTGSMAAVPQVPRRNTVVG